MSSICDKCGSTLGFGHISPETRERVYRKALAIPDDPAADAPVGSPDPTPAPAAPPDDLVQELRATHCSNEGLHDAAAAAIVALRKRVAELEETFYTLRSNAKYQQDRAERAEADNAKLRRVVEAAKVWAYCPSAGGYRDGPAVEDTCEELGAAVNEYLGINADIFPNEYWTLEEMHAAASKARDLAKADAIIAELEKP